MIIMTLELPKDLSEKLFEASKILDLEEKEIVNRAVMMYLDNVQKYN